MALADTYKDRDASLEIAQRAAFSEDQGLEDRLDLTMVGDYYRPFAAAYSWLASHPEWTEKLTGSEGLERRKLSEALSALAQAQMMADSALGLAVPEHLQIKLSIPRAPGPSLTAWR